MNCIYRDITYGTFHLRWLTFNSSLRICFSCCGRSNTWSLLQTGWHGICFFNFFLYKIQCQMMAQNENISSVTEKSFSTKYNNRLSRQTTIANNTNEIWPRVNHLFKQSNNWLQSCISGKVWLFAFLRIRSAFLTCSCFGNPTRLARIFSVLYFDFSFFNSCFFCTVSVAFLFFAVLSF